MLAHLRNTAHQLGLPFGERRMTYNSRRAQELGKWAENCGRGDAFHNAVFKAYFANGLNIATDTVLMDIARSVDLDPLEARTVIEQGQYRDAVDRDWQRSRHIGISAVPTFVINRQRLIGAQTYQDLTRFIQFEV
jgi:predicted DsbA family dithiol-disulfide isomerase